MKPIKDLFVLMLIAIFAFSSQLMAQKTPKGGKVPSTTTHSVKVPKAFSVAKPFINSYGVEWHPYGNESLTLTVSGPDDQNFQETFGAETLPYFDLFDPYGDLRPDGVYVYQLTVNPNIDVNTYHKLESIQESPVRSEIVEEMKSTGELPPEERTQTGSFTFKNHEVIMGDAVNMGNLQRGDSDEPKEQKDIVHNDDVIITFSECVGNDCVNGENFGFDTIRLKENNLRIKFDDTSTAASFPRNDWQLTANESSNGGAEKFSIEDITGGRTPFTLRAGAPSNSLYVDGQGDVGLNTNNPVVELHLKDGDTPTVRLEQDGSSGWTPQTWDLAGNETNFFLRDVTNGSKLPFRVRPGSHTDSLEIDDTEIVINEGGNDTDIRIESDGNSNMLYVDAALDAMGIGTNDIEDWESTFTGLELGGNSSLMFHSSNGSFHANNNAYFDGTWKYKIGSTAAANYFQNDGEHYWRVAGSGSTDSAITWTDAMHIADNGRVGINNNSPSALLQVGSGGAVCNGTNWTDGSSRDYKKEIEDLSQEDLQDLFLILDDVDMVRFLYKQENEANPKRVGMIAEEMPDILASENRKGLELGRHVGFLMGVVKALRTQNQEMAAELQDLRQEVEAMKEGN